MYKYTEYPRLLIFEMQVLPEYAFALDQFNYTDLFPGITEECSVWFWRFSICVGCMKGTQSEEVIKFSTEALNLLKKPSKELFKRLKKIFPDVDSEDVLSSWKESLETMVAIAGNRDKCTWFAPLYPNDKAYTKNPKDVFGTMLKNFDAACKKMEESA